MVDYIESNYTKTGKKVKSIEIDRVDLTYNKVYDVFIDNDEYEFIIDDVGHKRYAFVDNKNYYELVSDDTESNYTKTGKKVMCINSNRRVLTYKKVYDVFTNQDSAEFIIDDVGGKRYESLEFPYWCEKSDGMFDKANETKPKFKVGNKVRVVDIEYTSQATSDIKVGDVGVITYVDSDYVMSPYRVEFDDDYWWFTDKCIELVSDNTPIKSDGSQIVSDGGSSSYYAQQIPKGMLERFNATGVIEAKDVIRLFLGNDFNMGNIFKAYCRIISLRNGKGKAGIDEQYDLTKAKYFTEDELNYYLENN